MNKASDQQPIPPEFMESYKIQMQEMGEQMFLSLLEEYRTQENTDIFFSSELDLINNKIQLIDQYIEEVEARMLQLVKENNGLTKGLKRPPEQLYLTGYRKFSNWLKEKKIALEDSQPLSDTKKDEKITLSSIFNNSNNSYDVCIQLLDDLELTIDGISNTQPGRMGKLTGLITAIKKTPGMLKLDKPTDKLLLRYFNTHLGTNYTTFSKVGKAYNESIDQSNRFIGRNFIK